MENYDIQIARLIRLCLIGEELTCDEKQQLQSWLEEKSENRNFYENLRQETTFMQEHPRFMATDPQLGWQRFVSRINLQKPRLRVLRLLKYAAVLLLPLVLSLAVYLYLGQIPEPLTTAGTTIPGNKEATLTLASGKQIQLKKGDTTQMIFANLDKIRLDEKGLIYSDTTQQTELRYNQLEVPRGGEFRIQLSDGTVVYLNSGSRLKYPEVFATNERRIQFSGEAYFEVSKDSKRPFIVETDDIKVKVYGTAFNINTLYNKGTETVLVNGSISVRASSGGKEQIVAPGQLATYNRKSAAINLQNVDVRSYVAWKDGWFVFDDRSLEEILNTLSLWYDVDVFFSNPSAKKLHFTGHLKRYEEIQTILEAISETTGVQFTVKGQAITVL